MVEVNPSDLFEVRHESLFSSRDEDYLFDLYLPLVGTKALGIYLALLHLDDGETLSHRDFFLRGQTSAGEFLAVMPSLEAVGLVVSYLKKGEKFNYFIYALYAPKTPKEFFDNILFVGTLRKYLDNDKVQALAKKYAVLALPEDAENVSEGFRHYFAVDYSDPAFQKGTLISGGRTSAPIATGFDKNAFLKAVGALDPRFHESSFTQEQIVKLARIAALYSYSEEAMAGFATNHYDFAKKPDERLDFDALAGEAEASIDRAYLHSAGAPSPSQVHGDSSLAVVLRSMDKLTPEQFLSRLQHGNKPAPADLRLLRELVVDMGLSSGACNALILYMIVQNNGILSKGYMEKIAGGMVRKNLVNAIDAMNYLQETASKKKAASAPSPSVTKKPAAASPSSPDTAISDAEFNDLMSNLYTPEKKS